MEYICRTVISFKLNYNWGAMHLLHQNPKEEILFSCFFGAQDREKSISKYAQKNSFSIVLTFF